MKKLMIFVYTLIILINVELWGFIVPYLRSIDNNTTDTIQSTISTTPNTETLPVITESPIEIIYDTETIPEYTVPCTTVPHENLVIKEYSYEIDYKYGERGTPSIKIDTSNGIRNNTDYINTDEYKYLGKYTITGYTPKCKHCCGSSKGITASGVQAIPGYTVAADKSIPFGTTLYIEGYGYYVVEDRGVGSKHIDIAANNHEECYALTDTAVNVYIVPYITEIVQ